MQTTPVEKDAAEAPVQLHARAMDNLSFIRSTMARSSAFTAVPGWGMVFMGLVALTGGYLASQGDVLWWFYTWFAVSIIGCATGVGAMFMKSRRVASPVFTGPGRRFLLSFAPAIVAGAALTQVFFELNLFWLMPGMWLLLYGVAVATGGAFSVPPVPIMGLCFMVLGALTLFLPNLLTITSGETLITMHNAMLAAGFGGLHVVFGLIIAWKHGG